LNNILLSISRVAPVVTPELILQRVLVGLRDGTYSRKTQGIPIARLVDHVKDYYSKYKQDPDNIENLKLAKAFANLIYLLDPEYKKDEFDNILGAVTKAWLDFIPKSIKAAKPISYIPGEVMERLAIPAAKPVKVPKGVKPIPAKKAIAKPVEDDFNVDELNEAKYKYKIAEFCFVMRDYQTAQQYLEEVLKSRYMNVDANNLWVQNSILWAENNMQIDDHKKALKVLEKIKNISTGSETLELIRDKLKEATVLYKISILEEKCPLNEHAVGMFLRNNIGYKNFLKLTYFIFGNIEFHQRMEEIRVFPKKMIYPLLRQDPTPENEELIVERHEMHDKLIRELYVWFWELDIVKHYLSDELKEQLTEKFGEFGSGPVIYFRYISKGQYANIIISKSVELVSQGHIQEAKKVLYENFEFTGSKKIKGYLEFLRQHEKAKKGGKVGKDEKIKTKRTKTVKAKPPKAKKGKSKIVRSKTKK
jgi:hypothetical protein